MDVVKCSTPERFQPDSYWTSQGLSSEDDVRWEMMWQAATSENDLAKQAREHAEGCDYCGEILDRFREIQEAMKPGHPVQLALCPTAETLFDFAHKSLPADLEAKVAAHLKKCKNCPGELNWLKSAERSGGSVVLMTARTRQITMLATAAVLLIGAILYFTVVHRSSYTPIVDHVYSAKYRNLAKLPPLDRGDLTAAAPPAHWAGLDKAMSALELGDYPRAVALSAKLINAKDEAGAEYVLGRALYRQGMISASSDALMKAESLGTHSAYRCWTALQMGLILGDRAVIDRECQHLKNDPTYGEKAAALLAEVQKRG